MLLPKPVRPVDSEKKGKDVSTLIGERLHISAFFGLTGLILGYLVCIPLGIWKAIKNGSRFDIISSIIVFIGYSIPGYILGIVLLVYFGGDYFPLHGWRSPNFSELSFFSKTPQPVFIKPGSKPIIKFFELIKLTFPLVNH